MRCSNSPAEDGDGIGEEDLSSSNVVRQSTNDDDGSTKKRKKKRKKDRKGDTKDSTTVDTESSVCKKHNKGDTTASVDCDVGINKSDAMEETGKKKRRKRNKDKIRTGQNLTEASLESTTNIEETEDIDCDDYRPMRMGFGFKEELMVADEGVTMPRKKRKKSKKCISISENL